MCIFFFFHKSRVTNWILAHTSSLTGSKALLYDLSDHFIFIILQPSPVVCWLHITQDTYTSYLYWLSTHTYVHICIYVMYTSVYANYLHLCHHLLNNHIIKSSILFITHYNLFHTLLTFTSNAIYLLS